MCKTLHVIRRWLRQVEQLLRHAVIGRDIRVASSLHRNYWGPCGLKCYCSYRIPQTTVLLEFQQSSWSQRWTWRLSL